MFDKNSIDIFRVVFLFFVSFCLICMIFNQPTVKSPEEPQKVTEKSEKQSEKQSEITKENKNISFLSEKIATIYSDNNELVDVIKVTDPITKKSYLLVPGKGVYIPDGTNSEFRPIK